MVATDNILSGEVGWVIRGTDDPKVADSLEVATMRRSFASDFLHILVEAGADDAVLIHRGGETLDGRPADLIEVRGQGGQDRWLLVDVATHRLVAVDVRGGLPPQRLARRTYADFRTNRGLLLPYVEERFLRERRAMRIQARQIDLNVKLSDAMFTPTSAVR
jgi:hypothetical protein